jgi:RNA polymerase sigma factor (sigma-70 family)
MALPPAMLRVASDERLVSLIRGGSDAAFEAMFERHHRAVLALCRHMLGSHQEAEDAVQHAFLAAYRAIREGEQEIRLRPWLFAIARNRCVDVLRGRRERPLDEAPEPSTEHLSAEVQRRDDLRAMLADVARLPEDQRAALVMAEVGAASHEEIADVLGVRREQVKGLVYQARMSLTASRDARDADCCDIREQLATLRGGSLRRTMLLRHLRTCAGCREFRDELAAQRRALGLLPPVLPTAGLKAGVLGAGNAGGGAAAAGGGGGSLAAKALVGAALIGGGTVATFEWRNRGDAGRERQAEAATPRPTGTATATATATATVETGAAGPVSGNETLARTETETRARASEGTLGPKADKVASSPTATPTQTPAATPSATATATPTPTPSATATPAP